MIMICLSEDSKENNETNKDVIAIFLVIYLSHFVLLCHDTQEFQVITQINYSFTFSTETKTKI